MRKKDILIVSLLLICASLGFIPFSIHINGSNPLIILDNLNDANSGGKSIIKSVRDSQACDIEYFVSSKYVFPYVGRGFFIKDKASLLDLSSYQTMTIVVDPNKSDKFNCQLSFFVPEFSNLQDGSTQQVLLTPVLVKENQTHYRYNFKELPTPQWWYQTNNISEDSIPPLSYKQFAGISFSNHPLLPHDAEYELCVTEVIFTKRNYFISVIFSISALLYSLFLFIIRKPKTIFVPFKPVTISTTSNDTETLLSYIGQHYMVYGLTLETVVHETALSQSRVRAILKEECNKSFKQYLNHLRISEAVRLIKNTDNPISEIALSVGYRHVSTFNTVFKSLYGKSPSQLRGES